uniref:Uncharacterized protein n=1 Tax=Colletotrichum fructicola (strain Nara gc5) TaxID=1213859 RepID=L2FJK2_COLFN
MTWKSCLGERLPGLGARQDWILDPFEELLRQEALRSASSEATTARTGAKKKVVPQSVSVAVSAMRNVVGAEFDRLMGRIVLWREAMVSAGAEQALLDARLSVVAEAEWVTRPWGLALPWKFPAMDRMVSDLEGTVKELESRKEREG